MKLRTVLATVGTVLALAGSSLFLATSASATTEICAAPSAVSDTTIGHTAITVTKLRFKRADGTLTGLLPATSGNAAYFSARNAQLVEVCAF
jgi:hypothetical protein